MKYGYARVSSLIQLKGNSLQEQKNKLLDVGVPLENIVTEQFTGRTIKRPLFNQLIAKLKPGDELICCSLDRFARNAEDGLVTVNKLLDRNISIRILNLSNGQPLDKSPMGQFLFTMLLAFSQFERALILERTAAGRAIARTKEGYHEGRPRIAKAKIDHAMELLVSNSFKQVAEMTGISIATLKRYAKVYRDNEIARLKEVPRKPGSQGPEDERSLFEFYPNKRPGRLVKKK